MEGATASGKAHWESVVIGVSAGLNEDDRLESPIPDALLVAKTARDVGLCSDRVFTVTDADEPCSQAAVESALMSAATKLHKNSNLLVYFGGHGACGPYGYTLVCPRGLRHLDDSFYLEDLVARVVDECGCRSIGVLIVSAACRPEARQVIDDGWDDLAEMLNSDEVDMEFHQAHESNTYIHAWACQRGQSMEDACTFAESLCFLLRQRPQYVQYLLSSLQSEAFYMTLGEVDLQKTEAAALMPLLQGGKMPSSLRVDAAELRGGGLFRHHLRVLLHRELREKSLSYEMARDRAETIVQELCQRKPWELQLETQLKLLTSATIQHFHDALCSLAGDDTGGTASSGLGTGLVESSKSEASDCTVGEALQNIPSNVLQLVLERCREETVDHLVVRQMLDELGNLTGRAYSQMSVDDLRTACEEAETGYSWCQLAVCSQSTPCLDLEARRLAKAVWRGCETLGIQDASVLVAQSSAWIFLLTPKRLTKEQRVGIVSCVSKFIDKLKGLVWRAATPPEEQALHFVPPGLRCLLQTVQGMGERIRLPPTLVLNVRGFRRLALDWLRAGKYPGMQEWQLRFVMDGSDLHSHAWLTTASGLRIVVVRASRPVGWEEHLESMPEENSTLPAWFRAPSLAAGVLPQSRAQRSGNGNVEHQFVVLQTQNKEPKTVHALELSLPGNDAGPRRCLQAAVLDGAMPLAGKRSMWSADGPWVDVRGLVHREEMAKAWNFQVASKTDVKCRTTFDTGSTVTKDFKELRSKAGFPVSGKVPDDMSLNVNRCAVVLDVREQWEWDQGHVSCATRLQAVADLAEKDTPIVAYCAAGVRAQTAVLLLRVEGYSDVANGGGYSSQLEDICAACAATTTTTTSSGDLNGTAANNSTLSSTASTTSSTTTTDAFMVSSHASAASTG
ncbi:unnamed protein product, partial [Symbiodinium sp. KB8]